MSGYRDGGSRDDGDGNDKTEKMVEGGGSYTGRIRGGASGGVGNFPGGGPDP